MTRGGKRRISPVERAGLAVQRNRPVQQLVVGRARDLNDEVVPGIHVWIARNAGGNPSVIGIVPDVPFMAVLDTALVTPRESHAVKELVHIKLKRLRQTGVAAVEIHVVGEVVERWDQGVAAVGKPLGREVANQMVVPKNIGIGYVSANVVLGRIAGKRD